MYQNAFNSQSKIIPHFNHILNLKAEILRTILSKLGLIWFKRFRGEDLNVEVYNIRWMDAK